MALLTLRFLDHPERFLPVRDVRDGLAYAAPLLAPIGPDQESGPQGNVGVSVARLMQQPVLTYYLCARIGQNGEFFAGSFFPNIMSVLVIVNADGNKADA